MFFIFGVGPKTKVVEKSNLNAPFAAPAVTMNSDSNDNIFPYFLLPCSLCLDGKTPRSSVYIVAQSCQVWCYTILGKKRNRRINSRNSIPHGLG